MAAHARLKNEFTEDGKCHNLVSWLIVFMIWPRSARVAERRLVLSADHGVSGSNPTGGEILSKPNLRFISQSDSCSPFSRPGMTEMLLNYVKSLTIRPNHHLQHYFSGGIW